MNQPRSPQAKSASDKKIQKWVNNFGTCVLILLALVSLQNEVAALKPIRLQLSNKVLNELYYKNLAKENNIVLRNNVKGYVNPELIQKNFVQHCG